MRTKQEDARVVALTRPGARFGRLVVLAGPPVRQRSQVVIPCICDCGTHRMVTRSNLLRGIAKSCGCWSREVTSRRSRTHGLTHHPSFWSWAQIRARCENPDHRDFPRYGGRGITVCERWQSFEAFLADMGERPAGMQIDRKDNNGPYSPDNCRWATPKQQTRNRRKTLRVEGVPLAEWCERWGVPYQTGYGRFHRRGGVSSVAELRALLGKAA